LGLLRRGDDEGVALIERDEEDAQIASLRAQPLATPGDFRAYLVRKHVTLLADRPLLVLGFTTTPWWHIWRNAKRARDVQTRSRRPWLSRMRPGSSAPKPTTATSAASFAFVRGSRVL
jgi:hypothetical protein